MKLELVFSIVGVMAFIGWGALAFAPLKPDFLIRMGRIISVALAVAYILILVFSFATEPPMSFATLEAVGKGFGFPAHLLAGWTHFLAFDLFIGAWEAEDGRKAGLPHFVVLPCLALTFLFGPAGFLLFLLARALPRPKPAQA